MIRMRKNEMEIAEEEEGFLQGIARVINKRLEELLGRKIGFALIIFEFGNPSIGNYISNAERKSMIEVLRETANRLEDSEDMPRTIGSA